MGKVFVIDLAKCNGCYSCQLACKDEFCGNDWMPYSRPQPTTGHFWMKVSEKTRGSVPKVIVSYLPQPCMHCDRCIASEACKVDAFVRRDDGLSRIDPIKCTGCMNCVEACPYDAVYANVDLKIAQKCTGCAHLLDDEWDVPRCVEACVMGAMRFGEESEFADEIAKAEVLKPEAETSPRAYYINLPKRFVTGEVYDPEADEVLVGVDVVLTDAKSGHAKTIKTDEFGDFWFKQVDASSYTVKVEKEGFASRTVNADVTKLDINLGPIAMARAE